MSRIDAILARLDNPKPSGRDRWRCACPVCGEGNRSTLSIGVGDSGAVLLKCFKSECDPEAIAGALGLELHDLFPRSMAGSPPLKRRGLLSASQALDVLAFESSLVRLAAQNLANGHALNPGDLERLSIAAARVSAIASEVRV